MIIMIILNLTFYLVLLIYLFNYEYHYFRLKNNIFTKRFKINQN
jgi:hypothetical protein